MQNYFYFYFISIFIAIYWGVNVLWKYKNLSWLFFLVYTILASLWLVLYFLFFAEINFSVDQRLLLSKINFWLSPIILSSFLLFIYYFKKTDKKIKLTYFIKESRWELIIFLIFSITIFSISVFTELIIQWITLDTLRNIYREIPWKLNWIYACIYILFIPLGWRVLYQKNRDLTYIDKVRLSKISISMLLFLTFIIFLQVILPLYDIWLFENEMILFFALSVLYIANVIKRYYFSPIWYELSKYIGALIWVIVFSWTMWLSMNLTKSGTDIMKYNPYSFTSILAYAGFTVGVTYFIYILYNIVINLKKDNSNLEDGIKRIKRWMIQFIDFNSINTYLKENFLKHFPSEEIEIVLLKKKSEKDYFLQKIFWLKNKFIINDFVYNIENNTEFDLKKIPTKLNNPFLCIPIVHKSDDIIGLMIVGKKSFGDFYTTWEIGFLEELSHILSIHMKYIETYNQLEDISRNLDRKVDEKTIEYNTLISRQKEFIATLSHEIKAPLTSALLQLDNLLMDIESKKLSEAWICDEVLSISDNLAHTKTLLSQLFTTEYLSKNQAVLYPERVNIIELILSQYAIQKKVHQSIIFNENIWIKSLYLKIDKTQFIQVLTNLFGNAVKFSDPKTPTILLEIWFIHDKLLIAIEDNWRWIEWIELEEIFKKYTIGKNSIWLWIGLYLCKRIIELHNGSIQAKAWRGLSWIRIEIILPIDM